MELIDGIVCAKEMPSVRHFKGQGLIIKWLGVYEKITKYKYHADPEADVKIG